MIHDADLDDARFQRVEAVGIDRVLKGWAKEGLSDQEILRRGFECFDATLRLSAAHDERDPHQRKRRLSDAIIRCRHGAKYFFIFSFSAL